MRAQGVRAGPLPWVRLGPVSRPERSQTRACVLRVPLPRTRCSPRTSGWPLALRRALGRRPPRRSARPGHPLDLGSPRGLECSVSGTDEDSSPEKRPRERTGWRPSVLPSLQGDGSGEARAARGARREQGAPWEDRRAAGGRSVGALVTLLLRLGAGEEEEGPF